MATDEREWEYFLSLHRTQIAYENGYWATFRIFRVEPDEGRPHGWQYSLTLHDEHDDRIMGYDNAHPVETGTGPAKKSRRPTAYDHIDRRGTPSKPYKFTSPYQLLEDFLADVDKILKKEGL